MIISVGQKTSRGEKSTRGDTLYTSHNKACQCYTSMFGALFHWHSSWLFNRLRNTHAYLLKTNEIVMFTLSFYHHLIWFKGLLAIIKLIEFLKGFISCCLPLPLAQQGNEIGIACLRQYGALLQNERCYQFSLQTTSKSRGRTDGPALGNPPTCLNEDHS